MNEDDLERFELIILKGISLGFDHKKLAKILRVDEKEVVETIKALIKRGYVKYQDKRFGGELKLTKNGYETLIQYGGGISLESNVQERSARADLAVKKSGGRLKKVISLFVILFIV